MWFLALLACDALFGITPSVDQLRVTPDACGRWTAQVEASGDGDPVQLFADGWPAGSWTVQGYGQVLTATGASGPARTVVFDAQAGATNQQVTVVMPPFDGTVTLSPMDATFAEGASPQLAVSLTTACPTGSAVWTARASSGWQGQGTLARVGTPTPILLPPQPRGLHTLEVDVAVSGSPMGHATVDFYVGDPGDDLDRDGFLGGTDGPDCDDRQRDVNPGREEAPIANGRDDDCDGVIDEGTSAYDDDGDGLTEDGGDCDDGDPGRHPGAREVADCRDQDCDAEIDEGVTLVERDDAYDPNDTQARSFDLATSRQKRFRQELTVVTRDEGDEEWFEFFSQDGDWDDWGVFATVQGIPEGAAYDLELWGSGTAPMRTARVTARGDSVAMTGAAFRDDSGDYWLRIAPVRTTKAWCPVTIELISR